MPKKLSYFAYISRAKVNQLYDQITKFAVEKYSVTKATEGSGDAEAGANALFGFLRGNVKVGGKYTVDVEQVGRETTVQKLLKVIDHIEQKERILDLNELCEKKEGVELNAFCYTYSGKFLALANMETGKYRSLSVHAGSLDRLSDEIVISKKLLIEPGMEENALQERGPNNGRLVSSVCIVNSETSGYTVSLACSLKYFSDMGGSWDENEKEWSVTPHSGNWQFFSGEADAFFDSLLFIKGIRGTTIMGTPLFLSGSINTGMRI
jgi:hypothetical protein